MLYCLSYSAFFCFSANSVSVEVSNLRFNLYCLMRSAFFRFLTASMSVSAILVTRYYNNMRDSGLHLFFFFPLPLPLADMCLRNTCSGQCPRCDVNGTWSARSSHEKARCKTYSCQNVYFKHIHPVDGTTILLRNINNHFLDNT
jgi:hypothetical protein